jgi:hypothetical protein
MRGGIIMRRKWMSKTRAIDEWACNYEEVMDE